MYGNILGGKVSVRLSRKERPSVCEGVFNIFSKSIFKPNFCTGVVVQSLHMLMLMLFSFV